MTLIVVSLFLSTVQAAPVDSLTAKNLARDYWGGITRTPVERLMNLPVEIEYTAMSEEAGIANTPLVCYYIVNIGQQILRRR